MKYTARLAFAYFGLSVLATYGSFTIFKGPSTPMELFWDQALRVLLFPGRPLFDVCTGSVSQALIWGANSVLWGFVFAYCFLLWRKPKAG